MTLWISQLGFSQFMSHKGLAHPFTIVHNSFKQRSGRATNSKTKKDQLKMDILEVFGLQVRRLRHDAAISQQDLAYQCNIYRSYLSRIENGAANPTLTVVAALASALNVPVTEFFQE